MWEQQVVPEPSCALAVAKQDMRGIAHGQLGRILLTVVVIFVVVVAVVVAVVVLSFITTIVGGVSVSFLPGSTSPIGV